MVHDAGLLAIDHALRALDRREPSNLRSYPSVPAADEPKPMTHEELLAYVHNRGIDLDYQREPRRRGWDEQMADDVGIPTRGPL